MYPSCSFCALLAMVASAIGSSTRATEVTSPPPESFFEIVDRDDRDAAREFYDKYASAGGLPVVAAGEVADEALLRTCDIVEHMLAGRPDVLNKMIENGMYLIIIGKNQVYTDMPEYRNTRNKDYMNERVRGTGGRPTSFGEENLLSLAIDRYDDESIAVHEFLHTIDGTLRSLDPEWRERLNTVYRSNMAQGRYKGAYASSNRGEYWAEIGQAYFDCNRVNNWNHGPIGTREALRAYDPEGYELVHSTLNLTPETDWRYTFLNQHPIVIEPPAKFDIAPYYTKFSWAREFPIIGKEASDQAMLQANDTIRKMFAYRHDILKALINDDVKLVVLGDQETLEDLPEWPAFEVAGFAPDARYADYLPSTKLLVVPGNEVGKSQDLTSVGNPVIRAMTKASYALVSDRPVDPNWDDRGYEVQQYELNVERLDERFGEKVTAAYQASLDAGKWRDTPASNDPSTYFTAGVLAYFDASGGELAPTDADEPIVDRQSLEQYDPALYKLVHETMAYDGRVDWRFTNSSP